MKTLLRLFLSIVFLSSLALTGCEKNIDTPNKECNEVFGNWKWSYSTGGFNVPVKTPKTEGYNLSIQFDRNGKHYLFIDDDYISTSQFKFEKEASIYESGNEYLIYYYDRDKVEKQIPHSFEILEHNTLVLSEQCYNCYSHVYIKE